MPRPGPFRPASRLLLRFVLTITLILGVVAARQRSSQAAAEPVRGRVLDPDARPVAGAAGARSCAARRSIATDKTRADGQFGPIAVRRRRIRDRRRPRRAAQRTGTASR